MRIGKYSNRRGVGKTPGRALRRLEQTHQRRYVSIFGELPIDRHVYGTRETRKHEVAPLDARLELPESEFSHVLQDWDQQLCVQGPYSEARGTVQKILGPPGAGLRSGRLVTPN